MSARNAVTWMNLGRLGALSAASLFGAVVGIVGGYHFSSYYWTSVGPLQTDVATCRVIVDAYQTVAEGGATPALQRLSPHLYLCALQLDQGYRYLDGSVKVAVAEDLRALSALLARDETGDASVRKAMLDRLAKY